MIARRMCPSKTAIQACWVGTAVGSVIFAQRSRNKDSNLAPHGDGASLRNTGHHTASEALARAKRRRGHWVEEFACEFEAGQTLEAVAQAKRRRATEIFE